MRPPLGSMSRFTIFKVVVFPQPDGPTSTEISPSGTSRVRSVTAMVPSGKRLETESRRIMGRTPGRSPKATPASAAPVTTFRGLTEDLGEPTGGSRGLQSGAGAPSRGVRRHGRDPDDRVGERAGVPGGHGRAAPRGGAGDDLGRAAGVGHDDGCAACQRLDNNDPV